MQFLRKIPLKSIKIHSGILQFYLVLFFYADDAQFRFL